MVECINVVWFDLVGVPVVGVSLVEPVSVITTIVLGLVQVANAFVEPVMSCSAMWLSVKVFVQNIEITVKTLMGTCSQADYH
ncbi:MAG: hypothetical protein AB7G75_09545 [Candidatus Binatia bacterium]